MRNVDKASSPTLDLAYSKHSMNVGFISWSGTFRLAIAVPSKERSVWKQWRGVLRRLWVGEGYPGETG